MLGGLVGRVFGRRAASAPEGVFPTVEWQVGGHCNYDCSYCIQSKASRVGQAEAATVEAVLSGLAALPGRWDIKMSGGEPFASKRFMTDIIPGLVARTPHRISVLTNFSAPRTILERFASLTGLRLGIVSASLHLEEVEAGAFLDKAVWFRDVRAACCPDSSFVVNSVLVPGRIRELIDVRARVEAEGLRWFPQFMKLKTGVFPYDRDERALIERLVGESHDPMAVNRAPSYKGRFCHAGAWYFVLDQRGRAWSCRTAKRHGDEPERSDLGSMVDGTFSLRREGGSCPYDICPCTVPANRGIVTGVRRSGDEWDGLGATAMEGSP
jgi:MoaA/NifB/PqqE/SkfB family radical SAM enzyme